MEIHRCKFIPYKPHAINCLTTTPDGKRLAVGRANADIEIYNIEENWLLEKRIPGGNDLSVEALTWTQEIAPRLFSAGLHSVITEWDLNRLCPKYFADSFGGAVWCIAIHPDGKLLAAGCEDGCVRLFDIGNDTISYLRSFDRQEGRILSISWHISGDFIATGGSDSQMRKWNVALGRTTHRLELETQNSKPTLVWAVNFLADGTIVGGDSLGNVHFWDTEMGETIQTLRSHDLDVLCLASTHDGGAVFASGVDSKVVKFTYQIRPNGRKGWILSNSRRFHTHDVRALAMSYSNDVALLISGGVDTNIVVTHANENQGSIHKIPAFPQRSIVHLCPSQSILVYQDWSCLRLFRIEKKHQGTSSQHSKKSYKNRERADIITSTTAATTISSSPSLDCQYLHLLDIFPQTEHALVCSSVSHDGQWVACSTTQFTKLFRIIYDELDDKRVSVEKKKLSKDVLPAHCIVFSADAMISATQEMNIQIVSVDTGQVLHIFDQSQENDPAAISSLAASSDGQWLASCDVRHRISVYHLDSFQFYGMLPALENSVTHMAFDGNGKQLIVTLSNNYFVIFDIEKKDLSEWTRSHPVHSFPDMLRLKTDMLRGAVFHPLKPHQVILYGLKFLCLVDLTKNLPPKQDNLVRWQKMAKVGEKRKLGNKVSRKEEGYENFRMTNKYQPLIFVGFLNENSLVVVEREWLDMLRALPETYHRKRFGA